MKAVIITLALAGLATAPLDAQILGTRLPAPSTSGNVNVNSSWQVIGRDGNGNTIYERRTQDRNGNIIVQRARRNSNGSMTILSTNTVGNVNNRNGRNDCAYSQSTNSVGDIIFGRTNTNVNCDDVGNRVDVGWYQVGRGANNNSIYERRTRDSNGNLVIQRARRNSNGSFTILSTRYANENDKQWQKAERKRQKEQDKQWKKSHGDDEDNGYNDDTRYNNDDTRYNNGDDQYSTSDSRYSNSERNGKSRGKGHKGRD